MIEKKKLSFTWGKENYPLGGEVWNIQQKAP